MIGNLRQMDIKQYLESVDRRFRSGISREHSYRGDLEVLLRSLAPEIEITNEPANVTDCGNPDFVVTRNGYPVGFIEAKDVGKDLHHRQYQEQFERYRKALDNLIITDYLTFIFIQNGENVAEITLAEVTPQGLTPTAENYEEFTNRFRDFCSFNTQTIKSPRKLAEMMAGKARLLENILEKALTSDEESDENTELQAQYTTFKNILIHDLSPQEFSDIYAQTLAYGMFAARLHDTTLNTFSRQEAAELIPRTNPFLRRLFNHVAGVDIDRRIKTTVDNLAEVFRATNVEQLLRNFGRSTLTHDPIIHFYETFLSDYDKSLRRARGVWYTPEPVVNFIVKSVDEILKNDFCIADGLADTSKTKIKVQTDKPDRRTRSGYVEVEKEIHRLQILDPATGTGTFLAEVIKFIYEGHFASMQGVWSSYVENDLIPRLNGFELLMASYSIAHLKLDMLLTELGHEPTCDKRFQIFLTNSLEEHHPDTGTIFSSWLSTEANEANNIKRDCPVMVVIGNPPYSGVSANKGQWIKDLIEEYKEGLSERKINLDDDYIKFIRYAHYLIEKNGEGVVAYITNNSFLDGITQRKMRESLLRDFDKIYILDLHGDVKKNVAFQDDNVFDIQQGVSINLFVKNGSKSRKTDEANFNYAEIYGSRDEKYKFLVENSLNSVEWQQPELNAEFKFFNLSGSNEDSSYFDGFALNEIFLNYNSGIQTKNDSLLVSHSQADVETLVEDFRKLSEDEIRIKYPIKEGAWKLRSAIEDVNSNEVYISKIQYRPFDYRYLPITSRSSGLLGRPRFKTMVHFLAGPNIGLICNRQAIGNDFSYIGISDCVTAHGTFYLGNRGQDYILPLYQYADTDPNQLSDANTPNRVPNLNGEIIGKFEDALGLSFVPERAEEGKEFNPYHVLYYIFAVLHCPQYRKKHKDVLMIDFPRVPFPSDTKSFFLLCDFGKRLSDTYLMKRRTSTTYGVYPSTGSNIVENKIVKKDLEVYDEENQLCRIWISDNQYFEQIPLNLWNFTIGGYQPAQKWLKDRYGYTLTVNEIRYYQNLLATLDDICQTMEEIAQSGLNL